MLADALRARADRVAELNKLLDAQPESEDAGDWIAEIAKISLNRREERHMAVVESWRRLKHMIAVIEAYPDPADDVANLRARRSELVKRIDERPRFKAKLATLDRRIKDGGDYAKRKAKLPDLYRRIAELEASGEVITKEDFVMPVATDGENANG